MTDDAKNRGLAIAAPSAAATAMAELREAADMFVRNSLSPNTAKAYGRQWRAFAAWAAQNGRRALPADPETVRLYMSHLAQKRGLSTVVQASAAIFQRHKLAGHVFDEQAVALVDLTKRGIRRAKANAFKRRAPPLLAADIAKIVASLTPDLAGLRDRALIAVGFDFALRRSELGRLDLDDGSVSIDARGLTIRLQTTKRDQSGRKERVFFRPRRLNEEGRQLAACPVAWLEEWIVAAGGLPHIRINGVWRRPLFRSVDRFGRVGETRLSDDSIRRIVEKRARETKLDRTIDFSAQFSAHSLRRGAITSWLDAGIDLSTAADLANHASLESTRVYDARSPRMRGEAAARAVAGAFLPERAPKMAGAARVATVRLGAPAAMREAEERLGAITREVGELLKRRRPET